MTPPIARGQRLRRDELTLGAVLGKGGQGRVYELAGQPTLVYKQYLAPPPRPAALDDLIAFPSRLAPGAAALLLRYAAWPLATVHRQDELCGMIMPRVPYRYAGRTSAGMKLRELQYLLYPYRPMWGEITPPGTADRLRIVAAFTSLVDLLQAHEIVLGDISFSNLLWTVERRAAVYVIDCDSAHRQAGPALLHQAETPAWTDPLRGAAPADLDTDRYKLALVIGRVLAQVPDARPGDDLPLADDLPERTKELVRARFAEAAGARGTRPAPRAWLSALYGGAAVRLRPEP